MNSSERDRAYKSLRNLNLLMLGSISGSQGCSRAVREDCLATFENSSKQHKLQNNSGITLWGVFVTSIFLLATFWFPKSNPIQAYEHTESNIAQESISPENLNLRRRITTH